MPLEPERRRRLYAKLLLWLRAAGRAAIAQMRPQPRPRRWSDSDITIDPPAKHSTILGRRPTGQGSLKQRMLPRRHYINESIQTSREAIGLEGSCVILPVCPAAATGVAASAASSSPASAARVQQLGRDGPLLAAAARVRPSPLARRRIRVPVGSVEPSPASTGDRRAGSDLITGLPGALQLRRASSVLSSSPVGWAPSGLHGFPARGRRPSARALTGWPGRGKRRSDASVHNARRAAALAMALDPTSRYRSVRREKREAQVPNGSARPLTVPVTGHMHRTASMIDVLDMGLRDRVVKSASLEADGFRELSSDRPESRLLTMLATLYMPNTISTMTDKKIKMTAFLARRLPEFDSVYSTEKILVRESNRFHPRVVSATRALWKAFTNCLGERMTEKTHGVFFQRLKRIIDDLKGSTTSSNALRADDPDARVKNMRDDWMHDSVGNEVIDFKLFAMAIWEHAEIACKSVKAKEVILLLEGLVDSLTMVENKYGQRILAFTVNAADAYGETTEAMRKLRAVAALVTRVPGIKKFRSPVATPRETLPELPQVSGPPKRRARRIAIMRGVGRHRGTSRPPPSEDCESKSPPCSHDYLCRRGFVALLEDVHDQDHGHRKVDVRRVSLRVPADVANVVQNASPATLAMTTRGMRARDLAARSRTIASQLGLPQATARRCETADSASDRAQSPPRLLPPFRADRPSRPSTPGLGGCQSPPPSLGRVSRPHTPDPAFANVGRTSCLLPMTFSGQPARPRTPARDLRTPARHLPGSARGRLVRPSTAPSRRPSSRSRPRARPRALSPPRGRLLDAALRRPATPPAHQRPWTSDSQSRLPAVTASARPGSAFSVSMGFGQTAPVAPSAHLVSTVSPRKRPLSSYFPAASGHQTQR